MENIELDKVATEPKQSESLPIDEPINKPNDKLIKKPPYKKIINPIWKKFEHYRWKCNLFFLFQPFTFLSNIKFPLNLHKYIYTMTIAELLLIFFIIFSLIPVLTYMNNIDYYPFGDNGYLGKKNSHHSSGDSEDHGTIFQFKPISRTGLGNIAVRFFILTYITGTRNSIHDFLFGLGFERAIVYHKWFGIFAVLFSFFHGFTYGKNAIFKFNNDDVLFGAIATWLGVIICLSAFYIIRRKYWEIFLKMHWILLGLIYFSILVHGGGQLNIALIFLLFDYGYRIYMSFFNKTELIEIVPLSGNVIRVEFDKEMFTYEPGQYVFICFPAISLTEWHPFSISSNPESNNHIVVHIRVLGDWTEKLYNMALKLNNDHSNFNLNTIQCYVNGPYGQLTIPIFNYSTLILISGGIGITPLQSIFNDIIIKLKNDEKLNYKRIIFIWSVRDASLVDEFGQRHWAGKVLQQSNASHVQCIENNANILPKWYSPNLLKNIEIIEGETTINDCKIITEFYLTRVKNESQQNQYKNKFPCIKFGRPKIEEILKKETQICQENGWESCKMNKCGVGIASLCCGPSAMVEDVVKYSAKYGIDCHYEIFDF